MCFFSKQKTAYELRISDWSSDVCSSDLPVAARGAPAPPPAAGRALRRGGRRDHRRRAVPPRRGAAQEGAGPQAGRGGHRARGRGAGVITVDVALGDRGYPVLVGAGARQHLADPIPAGPRAAAVVSQAAIALAAAPARPTRPL